MKMDRDHERQKLQDKVAECIRLAGEFPDGITNKNLRDLAAELEDQICELVSFNTATPLIETSSIRADSPLIPSGTWLPTACGSAAQ